jgi:outer membrane protein OmpA-like peptidoglycan-associated protein
MKSLVPLGSVLVFALCPLAAGAASRSNISSRQQSATTAAANPNDAKGCSDSPELSRLPNATLSNCQQKSGDVQVTSGKDTNGAPVNKTVSGQAEEWQYKVPNGAMPPQTFSSIEGLVKNAGFTIVYEDAPNTLTATKNGTWCIIQTAPGGYSETIINSTPPAPTAAAQTSLADDLDKTGRVAMMGIHFDSQGALASGSDSELEEIAKTLTENPSLKLRIDAYAYGGADAADDLALSRKEAHAVIDWLSAHGVQAARLSIQAWGDATPLAQAEVNPGKVTSHTIEIVKQ